LKSSDMNASQSKAFEEKGDVGATTTEKYYDEGGDVQGDDMDNEMDQMCAEEFMQAIEHKDKQGVLDALRALIMSCKGNL
jgi:hypothetical protein